jgi:two-component system, NtrC family, response regulator AtoC
MSAVTEETSKTRVLVVDDEKLIRWSVSERLSRAGLDVSTAESGEEALRLIASQLPDIILLDVRLPGIDGLVTLRRALGACPELAVIMMSAHSTIDVAVEAMKHGAMDFLVKPFPFSALETAVERAETAVRTRKQIARSASKSGGDGAVNLVGVSPEAERIRNLIARLGSSGATTVLLEGESGVGKDVVSRAIHLQSPRAHMPFMQLNCAAVPEALLESELFGHERGAFTDAKTQKPGLFETARGGTVLLDEIGDLPPSGQAKLLLLLESKTFRRVGGVAEHKTDVRVIAATNVNLERQVAEGRFRSDLFFRLNVVRIHIPALRERRADIAPIASFFISRYNQETGRQVRGISPAAMELLNAYGWPGNVRELRNVIERAFILHADAEELRPEHLPDPVRAASESAQDPGSSLDDGRIVHLDEAERRLIHEAMEKARGNQSHAARLLGISRDTLRYRLKKFGMAGTG